MSKSGNLNCFDRNERKGKIDKNCILKLLSQAYLNNNPEKSVRIRIIDNEGFITIKGPSYDGGISRFEWEKKISIDEAVKLMKLLNKIILKKNIFQTQQNKVD